MLRRSAVVLIDALGFKGIWKRHAPADVLTKLTALADRNRAIVERTQRIAPAQERNLISSVRVAFLSDTIVLVLAIKEPGEGGLDDKAHCDSAAVTLAAGFTSQILRDALSGEPAIMYRGAIAIGDAAIQENFIVGPAVDEAAEVMNSAQGAFVWLAPSAQGAVIPTPFMVNPLVEYEVPLKGGDRLPSYCVTPFDITETPEMRMQLIEAAARSFGKSGPLDVAIKRTNTLRFLDAAGQALARFHAACLNEPHEAPSDRAASVDAISAGNDGAAPPTTPTWQPYGPDGEFLQGPSWEEYVEGRRDPAAARRALLELREVFPPEWAIREEATRHPIVGDVIQTYGRHHLLDLAMALSLANPKQRQRLRNAQEYTETRAELFVGLLLRSLRADLNAEPLGAAKVGPDWLATFDEGSLAVEVKCTDESDATKAVMRAQTRFFFAFMESFGTFAVDAQCWITVRLALEAFVNPLFGTLAGEVQLRDQGRRIASSARAQFRAVDGLEFPLGRFGSARIKVAHDMPPNLSMVMEGVEPEAGHESSRLRRTIEGACKQVSAAGRPGLVALVADQDLRIAWSGDAVAAILTEPWARPLAGALIVQRHPGDGHLLTTVQLVPGHDPTPLSASIAPRLRRCERGHLHADPTTEPPSSCPVLW